ncbi:MAG: CoA transferase, partial [Chloroflexota bacterium]
MDKALAGLKVVDFGWNITAPLVARCLADFGATVVKVESAKRPDSLRSIMPYSKGVPGVERGLLYLSYSCGKYGMGLDLSQPRGIEVATRLVAWADILVENFMPGTMEKLGLGYGELKKSNPGLIMVMASLQGNDGPHAQVGSLGIMMHAVTGLVFPMGEPDEPPTPIPSATTDFISPFYCLAAVFAALESRRKTGEGRLIDLSQYEAGVTFIAPAILDYVANGRSQPRAGNASPHAAPHNAYRCRGDDRWCAIAAASQAEWESFCKVVNGPAWTGDARFSTLAGRKENEVEMDRLVDAWTVDHTAEEAVDRMQAAGVAAGVVENGRDFFADPQLEHRRHFRVVEHAEVGKFANE